MNQLYITQQAKCNAVNFDNAGIVKVPLTAELLTFVQARTSTKPAQVLSHSMAREEGKGEGEKKNKDLLSN